MSLLELQVSPTTQPAATTADARNADRGMFAAGFAAVCAEFGQGEEGKPPCSVEQHASGEQCSRATISGKLRPCSTPHQRRVRSRLGRSCRARCMLALHGAMRARARVPLGVCPAGAGAARPSQIDHVLDRDPLGLLTPIQLLPGVLVQAIRRVTNELSHPDERWPFPPAAQAF